MKKAVKIVGGSLAGLAIVVGVTAAAAVFLSDRKMQRVVEAPIPAVDLSAFDADLARGQYIFVTRGCADCHGASGEGRVMINDKSSGFYVSAPNITRGSGPAAAYSDIDWIAVLRHGLKPSRTPVFIMPSIDYAQMADADVAALVAYIRSLPPTPEKRAEIRLPLMLKALYAFGGLTDAAEKIDHTRPAPTRVPESQHEQGAYVANTCMGCHGEGFAGGKIPGTPPNWPAAANLTSAADSAMARYATAQAFRDMMRSGKRADGTPVAIMPFEALRQMNDQELDALYGFLKSLQPKASGTH
jgi:mono/diheme cytochrome c family protein